MISLQQVFCDCYTFYPSVQQQKKPDELSFIHFWWCYDDFNILNDMGIDN